MKKMNEYINYIEVKKTPEELEKEFIREFVNFRKENNLIQELLSIYSNVNRVKIARIESGMHSTSIKNLLEILGPIGYTIKIQKINDENKKENKKA
jgi:transcriptional regulator with XRE-family HTH domain